jgi:hypothetical protein
MNEMDMFLDSEPLLSSVTSAAEKDGGLFIRYFLSPVRNLIGVVKHKLCKYFLIELIRPCSQARRHAQKELAGLLDLLSTVCIARFGANLFFLGFADL